MKKMFLVLFILLLASCSLDVNNRSFQFIYEVEIESSNGKKIELWIPVPQSNEVQSISNLLIDADGLDHEIKDELNHGNKYLYVYSEKGTYAAKNITMTFNVLRAEHKNIKYNSINPTNYLNASSLVPIGNIFDTIINNNNLNPNNMRKVYDYVLNGMHYGKPKSRNNQYYNTPWLSENDKYGIKEVSRDEVVEFYNIAKKNNGNYTFGNGNSLYACDIGVGNCTDYHSYFMSLSRTIGVPARFHMGFSIPNEDEGKVGGYHCWADYYIEDEGWYPVDISEADKNPDRIDYFYGTICNNRFEMMVGRDFELYGYENKLVNLFIYPLLEIDDIESNSFKQIFRYKNNT